MSTHERAQRFEAECFERIYAGSEDPWDYGTSAYERDKYAATLAALPPRALGNVLEVGCSIGVFTQLLAERCSSVTAIDFSPRALALARARLAGTENVRLAPARFPEQTPAGPWDAVVCSEVLYYLGRATLARAVERLEAALRDGASVLAVSWRGAGREEPMSGDEAHEILLARLGAWHAFDGRTPRYRLDRFDGDGA